MNRIVNSLISRAQVYKHVLELNGRLIVSLEVMSPSSLRRLGPIVESEVSEIDQISVIKLKRFRIQPFDQPQSDVAIVIAGINHLTGYTRFMVFFEKDRRSRCEAVAALIESCCITKRSKVDIRDMLRSKSDFAYSEVFSEILRQAEVQQVALSDFSPIAAAQLSRIRSIVRSKPKSYASLKLCERDFLNENMEVNRPLIISDTHQFNPLSTHLHMKKYCLGDQEPFNEYTFIDVRQSKVHLDSHIEYERSYYSVPHIFVGETVRVTVSATEVSIDLRGGVSVKHRRTYQQGRYVTLKTHMATSYAGRPTSPVLIQSKANAMGISIGKLVSFWLSNSEYPEHVYRRYLSLLKLASIYSRITLNRACQNVLNNGYYSLKELRIELESIGNNSKVGTS